MASLFGHLPAPKAISTRYSDDKHAREAAECAPKRRKLEREDDVGLPCETSIKPGDVDELSQTQPRLQQDVSVQLLNSDQITSALRRIAKHISSPDKFVKSAELLRQLLDHPGIETHHGPLIFACLTSAVTDPQRAADPLVAREYSKLFTAASNHAQLFSPSQRVQLDVYGLWTVLRYQLSTDDSFIFSRNINKVKELIDNLPELNSTDMEIGEEQALIKLLSNSKAFGSRGCGSDQPYVWDEVTASAARRAALLDCILACREYYKRPWAATAIEMLLDHVAKQVASRFLASQRPQLDDLVQWIRTQKIARKLQGPGMRKDASNDSTTAFENAQSDWSRASLSHRGKVGSGGDRKSEAWLG